MEFNEETKERIKEAKTQSSSIDGLSEKERELVFGKMVDRILDSKKIVNNEVEFQKESSEKRLEPSENIQELYHRLKPRTSLDNVMLIAYYFYVKKQSFVVKDLLDNHKLLLLPSPSNPSDLINKNRIKGYLMLGGKNEKKNSLFTITRKGVAYVEGGFKETKDE